MAVNNLITLRKGTATEWNTVNPVLASGEPGYDLTNNILKIGNGTLQWSLLPIAGVQGIQGLQGLQGISGSQGLVGLQGISGTQGITGSGSQGTQGISGSNGNNGSQGISGNNGSQGIQGIAGNDGAQGISGSNGSNGSQGTQGITGNNGSQGTSGSDGSNGSQGIAGSNGSQGIQGITGSTGSQGISGNNGAQGVTGSTGSQGFSGSTGSQGAQGITGSQGTSGNNGSQGTTGTQGVQGIKGEDVTSNAHSSVYTATTTILPNSPTYTTGSAGVNGGSGVGAYLQATTNGYLVIDSYSYSVLPNNLRVLVKNQSNQLHNGIYTITSAGGPSSTWKLTRASDYDQSVAGEVEPGDYVYVIAGTSLASTSWIEYSSGSYADGSIIIGTDVINFTQTSAIGLTGSQGTTGAQGAGGTIAYYGNFYDTTDQTITVPGSGEPLSLNSYTEHNGIDIQNGNEILFNYPGTYEIIYSIQFSNTNNSIHTANVWLVMNGNDVSESNS